MGGLLSILQKWWFELWPIYFHTFGSCPKAHTNTHSHPQIDTGCILIYTYEQENVFQRWATTLYVHGWLLSDQWSSHSHERLIDWFEEHRRHPHRHTSHKPTKQTNERTNTLLWLNYCIWMIISLLYVHYYLLLLSMIMIMIIMIINYKFTVVLAC